jgi:anti-sigma B factor antagonist
MSLRQPPSDSRPIDLVAGFSCAITERSGVRRVKLCGEVDLATAPELAAALSAAAQDAALVFVDLSELTFMDSTGLHVILDARARLRGADCALVVTRRSRQVNRTSEITGAEHGLEFVA